MLDPAQNNAYRALNAAWKQGASVTVVPGTAGGASARFVVSGLAGGGAGRAGEVARARRPSAAAVAGAPLPKPRVGLFQPWGGSMDEGWSRWVLEQYGFDLVTLHPEDFKTPIGDRVDVLILADDARIPVEARRLAERAATAACAGPPAAAAPPRSLRQAWGAASASCAPSTRTR